MQEKTSKHKRTVMQQQFPESFDLTTLNGGNGFTVPGVATSGYLGHSVSSAGDINGDNVTDLVLGAYLANSDSGVSYVIFGSRSGFPVVFNLTTINGSNGFTIPGVAASGDLGFSVSNAGDINGDGITDLLLGANFVALNVGASYVIFGSRSAFPAVFNLTNLNGSNGFTIPGITVGGYLGYSVSNTGDINGDNVTDLVLGANFAGLHLGASYVLFGSRSGFPAVFNLTTLNGSNGFTIPGIVTGSASGTSVSSAGDINGDTITDLVLGVPLANSSLGASYVLFGSRSGFPSAFNLTNLTGSNGFTIPGIIANGYLGVSVSSAGDINGDNLSDLVLGAYQVNSGLGASYVIFGSRSKLPASFNLNNLNGTNGFAIPGIAASGQLGWSVSSAGDINGDNLSDLVLGARQANSNNGTSYVIFGSRSGFPATFNLTALNGTNGFTVPGVAAIGDLGSSVSTAGDVNGDGISDLVLGAYSANSGLGAAYVIFGQNTSATSFTPTPAPLPTVTNFTSVTPLPNQESVAIYSHSRYYYVQVLNTNGAVLGGPIQLTYTLPNVTALPNSDFILTYQNGMEYTSQEFNPNGLVISNLPSSNSPPAITVLSNGNFVFIYQNGSSYDEQVFAVNGSALGNVLPASNTAPQVVSVVNSSFVLLYQNTTGDYVQVISNNGNLINLPTLLPASNSSAQATSLANGNFVITYQNTTGNYTQFFNASGLPVGNTIIESTPITNVTALPNNNAIFTYQNGTRYYSQILSSIGNSVGGTLSFATLPTTIVLANGNFVVSYQNGTQYDTQLFNANGVGLGNEIVSIALPTLTPLPNGGFILSYTKGTESYLQVFDDQGDPINATHSFLGAALQITPLTDQFVITYQQGSTTYVQLFNFQGMTVGNENQLAGELRSVTAFGNTQFVVMYQNGLNYYTQLFTSNGTEIGTPAQLSGSTTVINHPPVVLNPPSIQTVPVDQHFSFQLDSTQIFNDPSNTLTFFAKSEDNSSLPSWVQFDSSNGSYLGFSGVAPAAGDTRLQLQRPLKSSGTNPLRYLCTSAQYCHHQSHPQYRCRRSRWSCRTRCSTRQRFRHMATYH